MAPRWTLALLAAAVAIPAFSGGCGPEKVPPGSGSVTRHASVGGVYYRVSRGETLATIARTHHVTAAAIARENGLVESSPLRDGQIVFVPISAPVPGVTSSTPVSPKPPSGQPSYSFAKVEPGRASAAGYQWPVDGRVVLRFGQPTASGASRGIYVATAPGSPVRAARSGTVCFVSDSLRGYGRTIMLNHGGGLLSVYAGCSELLVKDGQAVVRGQAIARAGSGLGTQGPGVQFRVYRSGEPTDPLPLLP